MSTDQNSREYAQELTKVPTVAFLADSRASTVLLGETIVALLVTHDIKRGILDLASPAGTIIAQEFLRAGLPFDMFALQPDAQDHHLAHLATGVVAVDADDLVVLDAELVVLPAMLGSGQHRIDTRVDTSATLDLTPTTLPGRAVAQAEAANRSLLLIDTPENGLVQRADGSYQRRIVQVSDPAQS